MTTDNQNHSYTLAPPDTLAQGEFEAGNRGDTSGRNAEQNRAVGIDSPQTEGSRQGRERYKSNRESGDAEPEAAV